MPAIASTTGRLHAEFLRLLFWHAHRESEELFKLTGQLAQPNQDAVFSKRAAFFNSLKSKVGHIMAKASALRINLNLMKVHSWGAFGLSNCSFLRRKCLSAFTNNPRAYGPASYLNAA